MEQDGDQTHKHAFTHVLKSIHKCVCKLRSHRHLYRIDMGSTVLFDKRLFLEQLLSILPCEYEDPTGNVPP